MPSGLGVSKMANFPSDKKLERVRDKLGKIVASKPLPANVSSVDQIKHKLCEKFIIYKINANITQRAMANIIGIDESLMSKILHYHLEEFTTDRLVNYLSMLYPEVTINVDVA